MGAAWRELGNKKKAFNNILDMVRKNAWAKEKRVRTICVPAVLYRAIDT